MVEQDMTEAEIEAIFGEAINVGSKAGHAACTALVDICGMVSNEKMRVVAIAIAFGFLRAKLDVMKSFDPNLNALFNEFQKIGTLYADKIKEEESIKFHSGGYHNG